MTLVKKKEVIPQEPSLGSLEGKKKILNLIDTEFLEFSIPLGMNASRSSVLSREVPCSTSTDKKNVGIVEIMHYVSIRKEDNECGHLVTNESSCDVFEKALHMTHTREQRESACFEKRL